MNDGSHPSAGGFHLTVRAVSLRLYCQAYGGSHQREPGKTTLEANVNVRLSMKMTFPAWMCCSLSTGDGTP